MKKKVINYISSGNAIIVPLTTGLIFPKFMNILSKIQNMKI